MINKKIIAFLVSTFFIFLAFAGQAKAEAINAANWGFEDAVKRAGITAPTGFASVFYTADSGLAENEDVAPIKLVGGSAFTAWVTGAGGAGTFAPNSNTWTAGSGVKYWQINFSTKNYSDLKLSSKQYSSATGPRDFKVQWSLDGVYWYDLTSGAVTVATNWSAGVLNNVSLPEITNNKDNVYLRWIMTSNVSVGGGVVAAGGTNRIDDISIAGTLPDVNSWNFENLAKQGTTDFSSSFYTADGGTTPNKDIAPIKLSSGLAFTTWVQGSGGVGTAAPNSDHWNGGANSRYWQINFSSARYKNLHLFSKQRSSNLGPRDFKVQWSLDGSSWTDVAGSTLSINTPDNWTVGTLTNLPLPSNLDDQESVYLRWIMTSETSADGTTVDVFGTNRIDDIFIGGEPATPPVTVSAWDFEDLTERTYADFLTTYYRADDGISPNKDIAEIKTNGQVFTAYDNGSGGAGTHSVNSNTWDGGTKYWSVNISTRGYRNLTLYSKQYSSGTGPRDFKTQWSLDGSTWTDISGASVLVGDSSWVTGELENIILPDDISDKTSVYLRWLKTSETSANLGAIAPAGTDRIDDVIIKGKKALYTLTYTAGANGSLSGSASQSVEYQGSGTSITAVPAVGYHFVDWSDGSKSNPRTDGNIISNASFTANFAINVASFIPDTPPRTPLGGFVGGTIQPDESKYIEEKYIETATNSFTLNLRVESDSDRLSFSRAEDFSTGSIEAFTPNYNINLTSLFPESNGAFGRYILFLRFYTVYGAHSKPIKLIIDYNNAAPEAVSDNAYVQAACFAKYVNRGGVSPLALQLAGRILLQVENRGAAWWVNPRNYARYYMKDGDAAYLIMRCLGQGITDENLAKLKNDKVAAKKYRGYIFLQVQQHGEAWYIGPDLSFYYLKNGAEAYKIMSKLGLGISNVNLGKIPNAIN